MKISKTEGIFLRNIILILSCLAFTLISYGMDEKNITNGESRTITDMAGRRVKIPVKVTKVLTTSPPPSTFIFMLAPEKLGGWVAAPSKKATKFISRDKYNIPVFGWGGRATTNYEAYIAVKPDLVFIGVEKEFNSSNAEIIQEKFGSIPVVCIENSRNATGYEKTIRFMGDVLGVPDRAKMLNDYYLGVLREVQDKVAGIPDQMRTRV